MMPTPGVAQPGHQIRKQQEAQRLGQDDRGPATGSAAVRPRCTAVRASIARIGPAAARNTDFNTSVSQYPLIATLARCATVKVQDTKYLAANEGRGARADIALAAQDHELA